MATLYALFRCFRLNRYAVGFSAKWALIFSFLRWCCDSFTGLPSWQSNSVVCVSMETDDVLAGCGFDCGVSSGVEAVDFNAETVGT